MASGKELERLLHCSIWEDYVLENSNYRNWVAFDGKGNKRKEPLKGGFCQLRIMFYDIPEREVKILAELLRVVASTSSECMAVRIIRTMNLYTEVVIH